MRLMLMQCMHWQAHSELDQSVCESRCGSHFEILYWPSPLTGLVVTSDHPLSPLLHNACVVPWTDGTV